MDKIILASQSPRRRELLTQIGLDYQVIPSTVEEVITETDPKLVVQELSRQKAEDVAGSVLRDRIMREQWEKDTGEAENGRKGILVIGADTVVSYQGQILGKPVDTDDAVRMLSMLQGNAHSVFTGVTLIRRGPEEEWQVTFAEETRGTYVSHDRRGYPLVCGNRENRWIRRAPMEFRGYAPGLWRR